MAKTDPIRDWRFTPLKVLKRVPHLAGLRFGRLWCLGLVGRYWKQAYWACLCNCGELVFVSSRCLTSGLTRSCGCLRKEAAYNITHGLRKSKVYKTWSGMKNRVLNPNSEDYALYGGRGITIHPPWITSFEIFFTDVGHPPSPKHSLDRINNNGNYEPLNVRWATNVEQCRNKNNNRLLTYNGETLTLAGWAEKVGMRDDTLGHRVRKGWPLDRALTPP